MSQRGFDLDAIYLRDSPGPMRSDIAVPNSVFRNNERFNTTGHERSRRRERERGAESARLNAQRTGNGPAVVEHPKRSQPLFTTKPDSCGVGAGRSADG